MTRSPARRAAGLVVRPLQEFLALEAAGAILLLIATAAARLWVNIDAESYAEFWHRHIDITLGSMDLDLTLEEWVSDGLMAVFFYVVGLEIKRELVRGELADRRRAALPFAAAVGGMIAPALIYLSLNAGTDGEDGWGIPMATDIAFSVGLLAILGSRVPLPFKVFLLALAIVDDLGAIAVIAVFYTEDLELGWLALATALFALTAALARFGVRGAMIYIPLALLAWLATYESGVHATVAGVVLGFITPAGPTPRSPASLEDYAPAAQAPLDRLEHMLHPWTSYLIVPLFALASAGIEFGGSAVSDATTSRVGLGVALGLMIGKPTGIFTACYLAVRAGVASLPAGTRWSHILALGMVGGIGFTVSLFIAGLAFEDQPALLADAKMAVLAGSAIIGVAGLVTLRWLLPENAPAERA